MGGREKGKSKPGDKIAYCEIDTLLPQRPEFEFLRASSFKPDQTDTAGEEKIQREGVVLRPLAEEFDEDVEGRLSFKVINPKFLLKYDE